MVVWDSQVKDGYKRSKAPAADGKSADASKPTAFTSWDGKKTSGVVEELLKNASDKAYGANGKTLTFLIFRGKKLPLLNIFFAPYSPQLGRRRFCN